MRNGFLSCHNSFLLVSGLRKAVLVAALICLAISTVSCRSVKEVQTITDTLAVHDTTEIYIHDTTKIVEVRYDSVDREVEKIIYLDSNGVWHEKEKETLHHYIYQQSEEYKVKEAEYKSKITELERQLAEKQKVEYVEKELSWFQKTLMYMGVAFIACLIGAGVFVYFKIKKKV